MHFNSASQGQRQTIPYFFLITIFTSLGFKSCHKSTIWLFHTLACVIHIYWTIWIIPTHVHLPSRYPILKCIYGRKTGIFCYLAHSAPHDVRKLIVSVPSHQEGKTNGVTTISLTRLKIVVFSFATIKQFVQVLQNIN